jgi:acetylglutamate kinase
MNRAEVLTEALPYIEEFHGSYVVVKYGGHAMLNAGLNDATIRDTILLKYVGMKPIIVHGGGPEITAAMEKFGKKPEFIEGLRVTDEETFDIAKMVLVGKINTDIVSRINKFGAKGIGLSTERDYIPVISPIGMTEEGTGLNINSDTVAGELAIAVKAKKLIVLTDVDGVLKDVKDKESLLRRVTPADADNLISKEIIGGPMIPKVKACVKAVKEGVEKCHIINGGVRHSILLELFTDEGIGTMISLGEK